MSKLPPHPDAEKDYAELQQRYGALTQFVLAAVAWAEAEDACDHGRMQGLRLVRSCGHRGDLYERVEQLGSIRGIAVAGAFFDQTRTKCFQALACDATGSGWVLAPPDPWDRAEGRLP